jgi:hypothetical protein
MTSEQFNQNLKERLMGRVGEWFDSIVELERIDEGCPVAEFKIEAFWVHGDDDGKLVELNATETIGPQSV